MYEYKQSKQFMNDCEGFILNLEDNLVDFNDISFGKHKITARRMEELFYDRFADIPIFTRIDYICEHFIDEYETLYGQLADKDILEIKEIFESLVATRDIYVLYGRFLKEIGLKGLPDVKREMRYIDYEDVYPMLYMKYRLIKGNKKRQIRHLVIDEMQDYTYLQYAILNKLFDCPKTILGDYAQTLEEKNRDVLKFLPQLLGKGTKVIRLTKSYRNTTQIAEYADRIWHNDNITYFKRDGASVLEVHINKSSKMDNDISLEVKDVIKRLANDDYETKAVITLTMEDAKKAEGVLSDKNIPFYLLNENSSTFKKGLTVTPFYLAKGLEFDRVFVLSADEELGIYKKYLYIAATRALHELIVYKQ